MKVNYTEKNEMLRSSLDAAAVLFEILSGAVTPRMRAIAKGLSFQYLYGFGTSGQSFHDYLVARRPIARAMLEAIPND